MAINATPLTLADNLFENQALYPAHELLWSAEEPGFEGYFAFDGLRDLTWWQTPQVVGEIWVRVRCDVARPANMVVLDRGHNLTGQTIVVEHSSDGVTWTPALTNVVGTDGYTTPEGAWWNTFVEASAAYWRVRIPTGTVAIVARVTGLWLGKSLQFRNYLSRPVDPDRADIEYNERISEGGVRARGQFRVHRALDDRITLYDEAEYVAGVRKWVMQMSRGNVPFWFCLDRTNAPHEMWQYINTDTRINWAFDSAKGRTGHIGASENIPLRQLVYL